MSMTVDQIVSSSTSKFDWIVDGRPSPANARHDRILVENQHFVALATLGSIVPGWVLVIPREKAFNLASARSRHRAEFEEIRNEVQVTLSKSFGGRIYEFEHGPRAPNGLLGCGVEQAHLHLVALPFDLVEEVRSTTGDAQSLAVSSNSPWDAVENDRDYWLVHDPKKGEALITYPDEPISQGIRKIIAAKLGKAHAWNYRVDAFHEHILETQRAFQPRTFA